MQIAVDWDRYALQYDRITSGGANPAYTDLVGKVTDYFTQLPIHNDDLIVDLGGGTGNFTIPLAQRHANARFVLVDTSVKMLEVAKQKSCTLGLKNIEFVNRDAEGIRSLAQSYNRGFSHAIIVHCLYATRSTDDPEKPQRILNGLYNSLNGQKSVAFIVDINRPLKTSSWIMYCLGNSYKAKRASGVGMLKSILNTFRLFYDCDQAKRVNRYIDAKQMKGDYLMCSLDELICMVKNAGFSRTCEASDKYYRGRDNLVIAAY